MTNDQVFTMGMIPTTERPLDEAERQWLGSRFDDVFASSMNTYGHFVYLFKGEPGESHYDPCEKIWVWVNGQPNSAYYTHLQRQGIPPLTFRK